jgi:hypothetical protein
MEQFAHGKWRQFVELDDTFPMMGIVKAGESDSFTLKKPGSGKYRMTLLYQRQRDMPSCKAFYDGRTHKAKSTAFTTP